MRQGRGRTPRRAPHRAAVRSPFSDRAIPPQLHAAGARGPLALVRHAILRCAAPFRRADAVTPRAGRSVEAGAYRYALLAALRAVQQFEIVRLGDVAPPDRERVVTGQRESLGLDFGVSTF